MVLSILLELSLYFLTSYVVLVKIYGYTPSRKILMLILPFVYMAFVIIDTQTDADICPLIELILLVLNTVLLKAIFKGSKLRSIILISVFLYSVNITVSSLTVFIIGNADRLPKALIGTVTNVAFMIFCIVICFCKQKEFQERFSLIPKAVKRITLLSLISTTIVISLISGYDDIDNIGRWEVSIRIAVIVLTIVVGSAFPVMIFNSIGKTFYTRQAENFKRQINTQAKHYEDLSKSNYELRKFKHDFKNLEIGLNKYISEQDCQKAHDMLKDCSELLNCATLEIIKFDTGNDIVDAILTEKSIQATDINSNIRFSGAVVSKEISAVDLCVIFGNTLDNAIESCKKLEFAENNTIFVICKCINNFMFIEISNPVIENIVIKNNAVQTTKPDKINHGYGLYSLRKTVQKYNGTLDLSCENNIFKVEITLEL